MYKSRLFTSNVLLQKDELEEASLTISLTNLYAYGRNKETSIPANSHA